LSIRLSAVAVPLCRRGRERLRERDSSISITGSRHAGDRPRETAGCCLTRALVACLVGRVRRRSRDRPGFKMKIKFDSAQSRPQSQVLEYSLLDSSVKNEPNTMPTLHDHRRHVLFFLYRYVPGYVSCFRLFPVSFWCLTDLFRVLEVTRSRHTFTFTRN